MNSECGLLFGVVSQFDATVIASECGLLFGVVSYFDRTLIASECGLLLGVSSVFGGTLPIASECGLLLGVSSVFGGTLPIASECGLLLGVSSVFGGTVVVLRPISVALPFQGDGIMQPFIYNFDVTFVVASAVVALLNSNAAKLRLFSNNVTPIPTSVLSDFDQCDYGGYADIGSTFGTVFAGPNGVPTAYQERQWNSTPNGTVNTAYGVLLMDTLNGLLAAAKFPTPVNLGLLHQSLPVAVRYQGNNLTVSILS